MFRLLTAAFLVAILALPAPLLAQTAGGAAGGGYGGGEYGGEGSRSGLSRAVSKSVARTLTRGAAACHRLQWIYRYDCYSDVYRDAATLIAGNPAYREAFEALTKVQKVLEREVARNADPSAPKLKRGLTTYQPIKASAVDRVTRKTELALQEAETTLLRSGSDKGTHYVRIADAVNSNKVLLRSALLLVPGVGAVLLAVA